MSKTNNNENLEKQYKILANMYVSLKYEYDSFLTYFQNVFRPIITHEIENINKKSNDEILSYCEERNLNKDLFIETINSFNEKLGFDKIEFNYKNSSENDDGYKVGYKSPPRETQFKKGNKGNKKGRKSKKSLTLNDFMLDELNETVEVNNNGITEKILKKELISKVIINQLAHGKRVPRNNMKLIARLDQLEYRKMYNKKHNT